MSMLSQQADELRKMAVKLGVNGVCTGDLSKLCVMLPEAADTIESLRDRLQELQGMGGGECELRKAHWDNGECTWGVICSECGYKHEHETGICWNYAPCCGRKVKP